MDIGYVKEVLGAIVLTDDGLQRIATDKWPRVEDHEGSLPHPAQDQRSSLRSITARPRSAHELGRRTVPRSSRRRVAMLRWWSYNATAFDRMLDGAGVPGGRAPRRDRHLERVPLEVK